MPKLFRAEKAATDAVGWIWVALMALVAASSFWVHTIRLVDRSARSICCRSSR
ncbi:hypothetical protein [Bradyrhizobium sp.]|uniref:hypothetical protein n=1 Tax=Bradyrhizobium sp. TaxID=376 RepID=UPI00345D818B